MKKFAIPALAATAALGIAVPALAVDPIQTISVKVSPNKAGTKKKPKGVGLKVDIRTTPKDDVPFATRETVLFFDKNSVVNGKKFPSCTKVKVQRSEASCPKGSKVGKGTAQGKALGQTQDLKVTAFNGPGGKTLLLHVTGSHPLAIDSVIEGKYGKASGKYGIKLVVPIPANLQQPVPGVYATLTQFITSVKATHKGVPYIASTGCGAGGKTYYAGAWTYVEEGGKTSKKTAEATAPCKK